MNLRLLLGRTRSVTAAAAARGRARARTVVMPRVAAVSSVMCRRATTSLRAAPSSRARQARALSSEPPKKKKAGGRESPFYFMTPGMVNKYERQKSSFFKWVKVGAVVYAVIEVSAYFIVFAVAAYLMWITFDWPAIWAQVRTNSEANAGRLKSVMPSEVAATLRTASEERGEGGGRAEANRAQEEQVLGALGKMLQEEEDRALEEYKRKLRRAERRANK